MKKIIPITTKVMSIVHGQSEFLICCAVKSNLKLKHEIIARERGKSNIQVNSILDILNDKRFCTFKNFINNFPDIEYKKGKLINFKLFIIMDVDDCTSETKNKYINKELFKNHWLYEYIVPIYNDPDLEHTMNNANILITRKKDYFIVFPTNHGDLDIKMACDFLEKLKRCKNSNMFEYIEYCLSIIT